MELKDLVPDAENRRSHDARNIGMVVDALKHVGAARSIVIDEDNVILAGNGVSAAAAQAGITTVRVIEAAGDELVAVRRSGLSAEQKRALAIYDNRTAELAAWNFEQLAADKAAGLSLQPFWTPDEEAALLGTGPKAGLTDPDAVPEMRATEIQRGDLFTLGSHRLLCGDATVAADVARVMGNASAVVCLTDPPYSVNYDRSQAERGGSETAHGPYHEAEIDPAELLAAFLRCLPSSILVMSYPVDRHFQSLSVAFHAAHMEIRRELIWVKDMFSFWPSANYQQRHEPILVCAKKGIPLGGAVPANMSTVFEVPRPRAHELHPTAKPLELWRVFVTNHAGVGEGVFDPFIGSGTTVMACEQMDRVCYAMEIAPQYCQVAIDRWEAFTGQHAVKVDA